MADYYVMKKGQGTMNVPALKLQEYLADGWQVIKEPDPKPDVKQVTEPPAPPKAESEAEEESPVTPEQAVEKLGKSSRRSKKSKA